MGQKVHPLVLRVGYIEDWRSKWFAKGDKFVKGILEDRKIRDLIRKTLKHAAVSFVEIRRYGENKLNIKVHTARPGVIIGRKGVEIEKLKLAISKLVSPDQEIYIDTEEIQIPEKDAQIVADNVAFQIERRVPYKRAVKRAIDLAMQAGAEGIKVNVAGRLGGAEIARSEVYKQGKIPLSTLKAKIDYALSEAQTTYGTIGIKVWIYHGEGTPLKEVYKEQFNAIAGKRR